MFSYEFWLSSDRFLGFKSCTEILDVFDLAYSFYIFLINFVGLKGVPASLLFSSNYLKGFLTYIFLIGLGLVFASVRRAEDFKERWSSAVSAVLPLKVTPRE